MPKKLNNSTLKMEKIRIDSIHKHPKNARLHDEENIQAVMRSLAEFGQRTPLVVGKANSILKGNGTHEAAKRLGWKMITITRVYHLSLEQEAAYAIADNKASDLSEFDFSTVAAIMGDLRNSGIDLTTTGFRDFEIEPLLEAEFNPGNVGTMPAHPEEESLKLVFINAMLDQVTSIIKRAREIWSEEEKNEEIVFNILLDWANLRMPEKRTVRKIRSKNE